MSVKSTSIPMDKSKFGPGPWMDEPDRKEFTHDGYTCLIVRVPHGHLCGYVAVPSGHPWHGKGYDDVAADVHGGLTYASACSGSVCHVPKAGEPDDVWWLGFDHAHLGDYSPGLNLGYGRPEEYRTIGYAEAECRSLAEQAKEAARG